jgi:hypothetical protein
MLSQNTEQRHERENYGRLSKLKKKTLDHSKKYEKKT